METTNKKSVVKNIILSFLGLFLLTVVGVTLNSFTEKEKAQVEKTVIATMYVSLEPLATVSSSNAIQVTGLNSNLSGFTASVGTNQCRIYGDNNDLYFVYSYDGTTFTPLYTTGW